MSIHIYEDSPQNNVMRQAWTGRVATDASDFADMIWVILPDLDEELRIGPCRWQSRNSIDLPSRGDVCLVIFDNENRPWVPVWWPYD